MSDEAPSPGWGAIDRVLDRLYDGREPEVHYGTIIRYSWGGPDPLDGISAYKNLTPSPHWHFVSYGLSELYEKESDDPDRSGFGFELTFRLACRKTDRQPPQWALNFLQNLARYVFETGNAFAVTHHIDLNGPIAVGKDTDIRAAAFERDPQLRPIKTPRGRLTFLQVVGITLDELEAMRDWNTRGVLRLLARDNPLLITNLRRRSILRDPDKANAARRGAEKYGSSMESVYTDLLRWRVRGGNRPTAEVTLGAIAVPAVLRFLDGRIPFMREGVIRGPKKSLRLVPTAKAGWEADGNTLVLSLSPALGNQMRHLEPHRGRYRWKGLPGFTVVVVPTEVTDHKGNVTEVIG